MAVYPPSLTEVRAWCQVPASSVTDVQLQAVLDAESADQVARCDANMFASAEGLDAAYQALLRRCQRALAARGVPLGMVESEYGAASLPSGDSEVNRLEGPYRNLVVA